MGTFLQIPGNIKQQFIPFVLDPDSMINDSVDDSKALKFATPQIFSFRPSTKKQYEASLGGYGHIAFFPNSASTTAKLMDKDLSFQSLYSMDENNSIVKEPLTFNSILNRIPCVSIREYLPDTRLNQAFDLFKTLLAPIMSIGRLAKTIAKSDDILDMMGYALKYIVGLTTPSMWDENDADKLYSEQTYPFDSFNGRDNPRFKYVMKFPYWMYYMLQSCTTTNIYEVPAVSEDKTVISSNGQAGWNEMTRDFSITKTKLFGFDISYIGKLMGNVGVNFLPFWDASSARRTNGDDITIKFDLFNDTLDGALMNFIFVNTIAPNNKWVQYNILSHSSSLYDVKIEGLNRLFACSGNINVTYGGVLRDPSYEFIYRLCTKHLNNAMNANFSKDIVLNKLIKIPDVYHVSMQFKSIFPPNFNNYMYAYSQNIGHIEQSMQNGAYVEGDGANFGKFIGGKIQGLIDSIQAQKEQPMTDAEQAIQDKINAIRVKNYINQLGSGSIDTVNADGSISQAMPDELRLKNIQEYDDPAVNDLLDSVVEKNDEKFNAAANRLDSNPWR